MNNRLKFRVWDTLRQQFIYPDKGYQGHYTLDLNGRFYNLQDGSGGDEYVVQQFVGYQDKNHKDIYEGDIVKTDPDHPALIFTVIEYTHGKIVYINSSFKVCQKYIGAVDISNYAMCDCCPCGLEVIGHIFEQQTVALSPKPLVNACSQPTKEDIKSIIQTLGHKIWNFENGVELVLKKYHGRCDPSYVRKTIKEVLAEIETEL